jgi:Spy/CpxP family protein refolding chaperone
MRTIFGILAALMLVCPAYSAEDKDCPMTGKAKPRMEKGDRMMRGMDLSPEQKERLKEFRKKNMEEMKPLRRELEDQVTALRRLVQDNASESKINAQLKAIKQTQKKLERAIESHMAALEDILTPIQRAKFLLKSGKRLGGCAGCPMAHERMGERKRPNKR